MCCRYYCSRRFVAVLRGVSIVKKLWRGSVSLVALTAAGAAIAADLPVKLPPVPPPTTYNWTGWYVGLTAGAAWGQYDPRTSTIGDGYMNAAQAAAVTTAGTQTIKPSGFATGIEGG